MEKSSKLNERLTLIANIAVVLGIVFLGLQMRQNTEMMRAQIRDSLTERVNEANILVASSPELVSAVASLRAAAEGRPATAEDGDAVYLFGFIETVFRAWEDEYFQHQLGLFGDEEMVARRWNWRNVLIDGPTAETAQGIWERYREGFAPDFRAVIDSIMAEGEN